MNARKDKRQLIDRILATLEARLDLRARASGTARAEATHEDSKAESKYDTRGLEAGYLANGQAMQADRMARAIEAYRAMEPVSFAGGAVIGEGALVEARMGPEVDWYFIGPAEGGFTVTHQGRDITVISADSMLARAFLGKRAGESTVRPAARIVSVG